MLKYPTNTVDKECELVTEPCSQTEVRYMSKKHDGHAQKKKLTKKEQKAINHAKLMASKAQNNVVDINAFKQGVEDKKKAA